MKIIIKSVMIVLISAILFCSCTNSDNQTAENTEQTQESDALTDVSETISETTEQNIAEVKTEITTTTAKVQTTQSPKNYCIAEGCYKEADKSITGISGQTEYYCKEHYDELEELINMLLDSTKSSSDSYGSASMGEKNALSMAKNYIDIMPFSYSGLVEQLEFEGYSHSEAVYGADNCGADWNKQAEKQAANYLALMPFSRQELIEQLEFEGYTHSQAVYGAEANGY